MVRHELASNTEGGSALTQALGGHKLSRARAETNGELPAALIATDCQLQGLPAALTVMKHRQRRYRQPTIAMNVTTSGYEQPFIATVFADCCYRQHQSTLRHALGRCR